MDFDGGIAIGLELAERVEGLLSAGGVSADVAGGGAPALGRELIARVGESDLHGLDFEGLGAKAHEMGEDEVFEIELLEAGAGHHFGVEFVVEVEILQPKSGRDRKSVV